MVCNVFILQPYQKSDHTDSFRCQRDIMSQQLYAGIYTHIHPAHCSIGRAWVTGFFQHHMGTPCRCMKFMWVQEGQTKYLEETSTWELLNKPQRKSLDCKWFQGSGKSLEMQMKARGVLGQGRKGNLLWVILQRGLLLVLSLEKTEPCGSWTEPVLPLSQKLPYGSYFQHETYFLLLQFPASKHSLLHVRAHLFHFHWKMGGRINSSG